MIDPVKRALKMLQDLLTERRKIIDAIRPIDIPPLKDGFRSLVQDIEWLVARVRELEELLDQAAEDAVSDRLGPPLTPDDTIDL